MNDSEAFPKMLLEMLDVVAVVTELLDKARHICQASIGRSRDTLPATDRFVWTNGACYSSLLKRASGQEAGTEIKENNEQDDEESWPSDAEATARPWEGEGERGSDRE
jgi:hypothetical protein